MVERKRDLEYQKRTEEVFEQLKTAIQPVIDGDMKEMEILREVVDPMTGRKNIYFFPVANVFGERGRRVFERLRREIEYAPDYDYFVERKEGDDYYHYVELWNVPTKYEGVVLERREFHEKFRKKEEPERTEWWIVSLHPKGRIQRVKERTRQIISHLSRSPWPI